MKPPPRARTKPFKGSWSEAKTSRKLSREWTRRELKRLATGLKKISWTASQKNRDVNFAFLKELLPVRSMSQLSSMVDSLKTKLISGVSFQLQKVRWEEERSRKPLDEWTHLASALAGTVEVLLSAAFSQMLLVSSTEPCTGRNCGPSGEPGRALPRAPPVPLPVFLKTPAPTMGLATRLLAPCFPTPFVCSSQTVSSTGQVTHGFSSAAVRGGTSGTTTLLSSPQSLSPVPSSTPPSSSVLSRCPSTFPPSSPTAAGHSRFGQSIKCATKDHQTAMVDFEKIYSFLSAVQNPGDGCRLTPMESAVVLDLLMSLPKELCLMDGTTLHRHMTQVFQSLSAPAGSRMAGDLLMTVGQEPVGSACSPQSDPCRTAGRPHVSGGGEKKLNESGGANMLECSPPLNPFMVPLKLLQRRHTSGP